MKVTRWAVVYAACDHKPAHEASLPEDEAGDADLMASALKAQGCFYTLRELAEAFAGASARAAKEVSHSLEVLDAV